MNFKNLLKTSILTIEILNAGQNNIKNIKIKNELLINNITRLTIEKSKPTTFQDIYNLNFGPIKKIISKNTPSYFTLADAEKWYKKNKKIIKSSEKRLGKNKQIVKNIFNKQKLPLDFGYKTPIAESWVKKYALSPIGAYGTYQLNRKYYKPNGNIIHDAKLATKVYLTNAKILGINTRNMSRLEKIKLWASYNSGHHLHGLKNINDLATFLATMKEKNRETYIHIVKYFALKKEN